ncbi:hypothetical protein BJ878DRAFT_549819 [Calycina marina]|uniref:FAD-binding domain-containing protein n=1 Tax=Calycina marina TaxID=1763456 RepID=A0A9P7Z334_9HELO|nr:hypothetical protein BJ878DRAFT_549819 [Calycina marina]
MAPLKTLVVGAGIGGNSVAFWLSKMGHHVMAIEGFPSQSTRTVLQIDFRGHGVHIMKLMGFEQATRAKCAPEQGLQVVDKHGKRRGYFPANKSCKGKLCQIIYDIAANAGANLMFESSVKNFDQKAELGADTPDAFLPLKGTHIACFTIPEPMRDVEEFIATMYMDSGRCGQPKDAQGDISKQKDFLAETFRCLVWCIEDFLNPLNHTKDFYCQTDRVVVLLGDAVNCPSVITGRGSTLAIAGAYILAGEIGRLNLSNTGDYIRKALQAYRDKFRPFMDQVQKCVDSGGNDMRSGGTFGVAVFNTVVSLDSFFKINIGAWFLKEEVKGRSLPVYEAASHSTSA